MSTIGQRVIVVLRTPSLGASRRAAGGAIDIAQEQAWTNVGSRAQRLLARALALAGRHRAARRLRFTRVLDGFSAVVRPERDPLVERDPDVAGVYPVRVAYPATISPRRSRRRSRRDLGDALASAGIDGRGVTVAMLDTGVDRAAATERARPSRVRHSSEGRHAPPSRDPEQSSSTDRVAGSSSARGPAGSPASHRRIRAADPRRGLAAGCGGRRRRLRAQRSDHRRARPGRRSERRRRRA